MGPFDDPNALAKLYNLLKNPVRLGAGEIQRTIPYIGGPMETRTPRGASPRYQNNGTFGRRTRQGENFGRSLADALTGLGAQTQQTDPLQDLYGQLIGQLQSPVQMPTSVNTEDLMAQVRKALDPIYNQRSQAAQNQSQRGRAEVKDMYRSLSNDYERLAPEQVTQSKAAQEEIKQLYGQLRSNIEGSYSRISDEQSELFQELGIEDALPEVMDEQQDLVTEDLKAASQAQAQEQQRYLDIGQMDATYYREGSPNATMAGNEIQTSMLAELQNYLQQVEAERSSGIQTAYMDQLNQANSQLAQQQQMAQNEVARRQGMLWEMLQGQLNARNQPQQQLTPDSFMSQLPSQQQNSVASAFTRLQRSPEAVYGKVEDKRNPVPGTFVETTPQWFMAQADEMLRRGEIDPVTHQALLMYMQLYYGNK